MTQNEGHVLTHLGLGDQITSNGLIRELYKRHPKLYVYSKLKYFYTIEYMYKDLNNLQVLPLEEQGAYNFTNYYEIKNFYHIKYPFNGMPKDITVEKGFYYQAEVDFDKKWTSFFVNRNLNRERVFFNSFNLEPNKYVFIHDDMHRGQVINNDRISNKDLKIFRVNPNYTHNIFDYCKIIENAKEIHVIESCFMFMIDLIFKNVTDKLLAIHRYTKPIQPFEYPTNKLDWKIYV